MYPLKLIIKQIEGSIGMHLNEMAELVIHTKNNNSQAFTLLFENTYQKLYYLSLSMLKNTQGAKEALQEVYIKVLGDINTLDDPKSFMVWSHKIAYDVCNEKLDKRSEINNSDDYQVLNNQMKTEKERAMMRIIDSLPIELKSPLVFKYYVRLKDKEISEIMGCSEDIIKSSLVSARSKIKSEMSQKYKTISFFGITQFQLITKALYASSLQHSFNSGTALQILTKSLVANQLASAVNFTPVSVQSPPLMSMGQVIGIGSVALLITSTATITLYAAYNKLPEFVNVSFTSEYTTSPIQVSAELTQIHHIQEFYAVSKTHQEYYGTLINETTYLVDVPDNGDYILYAITDNKKEVTAAITVTSIDDDLPVVKNYIIENKELKIYLEDITSGIDYSSIYALKADDTKVLPIRTNIETSEIIFDFPDSTFNLYVSDLAGNISKHRVEVV